MVAPIVPLCRFQTNNTLLSCSRTTQHHNLLHFIVIHNDYRSSPLYQCGCVLYLQHSSCINVGNLVLVRVISDVTFNPYVGYKKDDDVDDS